MYLSNSWFAGFLQKNQTLTAGDYLTSPNGKIKLQMCIDGNLALYDGKTAIWSTGTSSDGGATVTLQTNGNLVVTDTDTSNVLWISNTYSAEHPALSASVTDDGNFALFDATGYAIWSAGEV